MQGACSITLIYSHKLAVFFWLHEIFMIKKDNCVYLRVSRNFTQNNISDLETQYE